MESSRIVSERIALQKRQLVQLQLHYTRHPDSELHAPDWASLEHGSQLYDSFSDAELLSVLRRIAEDLGHPPAQREVYAVYRDFIKQRFRKWPHALARAGLGKAAGQGAPSLAQLEEHQKQIAGALQLVRQTTADLGRIAHPSDLPDTCKILKKEFASWHDVLQAAHIEQIPLIREIPDLEDRYHPMFGALQALAEHLGRAPLRSEVPPDLYEPLVQRCGSWRNTLYQIGLEPVRHIRPFASTRLRAPASTEHQHRKVLQDCHYRVLNLDDAAKAQLVSLRRLMRQLGRPPHREEVPVELRRLLQQACGSWSNALYQLELPPRAPTRFPPTKDKEN